MLRLWGGAGAAFTAVAIGISFFGAGLLMVMRPVLERPAALQPHPLIPRSSAPRRGEHERCHAYTYSAPILIEGVLLHSVYCWYPRENRLTSRT